LMSDSTGTGRSIWCFVKQSIEVHRCEPFANELEQRQCLL